VEEEESDQEIAQIERNNGVEHSKANTSGQGVEDSRIKTNLEFLLSQNDILPLLKKINKERGKSVQDLSIQKFTQKVNFYMTFRNQYRGE
jgi:hypothetical protein